MIKLIEQMLKDKGYFSQRKGNYIAASKGPGTTIHRMTIQSYPKPDFQLIIADVYRGRNSNLVKLIEKAELYHSRLCKNDPTWTHQVGGPRILQCSLCSREYRIEGCFLGVDNA